MKKDAGYREFEIWSEGYRATGQSAGAHFHGRAFGRNFKEACINFAKMNPEFADFFNPEPYPRYWGCRLFDNRADAQARFG